MSGLYNYQVEEIHEQLRRNGIASAELEVELADHIATAIEETIEKSGCSFDDALQYVIFTFGYRGLEKMQQAHNKVLVKRAWQKYKEVFVNWVKSPRVLYLPLLYGVCFFFMKFLEVSALLSKGFTEEILFGAVLGLIVIQFQFLRLDTDGKPARKPYGVFFFPFWYGMVGLIIFRTITTIFIGLALYQVLLIGLLPLEIFLIMILKETNKKLLEESKQNLGLA